MLVLSRRKNEAILINGNVRLVVSQITGTSVRLAIEAPRQVSIDREEVAQRKKTKRTPAKTSIAARLSEGQVQTDSGTVLALL